MKSVHTMLRASSALAIMVIAGCTAQSEPEAIVPALWRDQIDQVIASDDPDVGAEHRSILADYAVSDAEYQGLRQELSDCLTGHGIEHDLEPTGGNLTVAELPGDTGSVQTNTLATACMDSTTGPVESIYLGMRENPEGLGRGEAMRQCLDEADVAEYGGVAAAELERLILAAELEPSTPEAELCAIDPFGSQGLTLDDARAFMSAP